MPDAQNIGNAGWACHKPQSLSEVSLFSETTSPLEIKQRYMKPSVQASAGAGCSVNVSRCSSDWLHLDIRGLEGLVLAQRFG